MDALRYEKALLKLAQKDGLIDAESVQQLADYAQELQASGESPQIGPYLLEAGILDLESLHQLYAKRDAGVTECESCGQFYMLARRPQAHEEREGKGYVPCAKCGAISVPLPDADHALVAAAPLPNQARPSQWSVLNEKPRAREASEDRLDKFRERRNGRIATRERKAEQLETAQSGWQQAFAAERAQRESLPDGIDLDLAAMADELLHNVTENIPRFEQSPVSVERFLDYTEHNLKRAVEEFVPAAVALGYNQESAQSYIFSRCQKIDGEAHAAAHRVRKAGTAQEKPAVDSIALFAQMHPEAFKEVKTRISLAKLKGGVSEADSSGLLESAQRAASKLIQDGVQQGADQHTFKELAQLHVDAFRDELGKLDVLDDASAPATASTGEKSPLEAIRALQHELMALPRPLRISEIAARFEPLYEALQEQAAGGVVGFDQLNFFLEAKSKVCRAHYERMQAGEQPSGELPDDELEASTSEAAASVSSDASAPSASAKPKPAAKPVSVGMTRGAMPVLSNEEALALLQAGEEIRGCQIPELILSRQTFNKKVTIEGCEIGELYADAATFKRKTSFKGSRFETRAVFAECTFGGEGDFKSTRFSGGADFKRVTFERKVSFNYANFPQHATFTSITFQKDAILSNIHFDRGIDLSGTTAEGNFGFSANTVGFRSNFTSCAFKGKATLSNTIFQDVVDFTKCSFETDVKLFGTTFNRITKFNDVKFKGPALFVQMVVEEDANFTGATFYRELRLDSARSRGAVRLDSAVLKPECTLSMQNCQIAELQIAFDVVSDHLDSLRKRKLDLAAAEFAYLKRNYEAQTEYDSEDRAYYMQRSLARKASKPRGLYRRLLTALEMIVLDWACGYGTKPINILWTVLLLWLGFAGLFYGVNTSMVAQGSDPLIVSERGAEFGPLDAALFSFKWFINAEIGDFAPVAGTWIELVVMAEVALGYAILFLLVATFMRKVAR